MNKKELELKLERLENLESAKFEFEQYSTPASIAADILNYAYLTGDIEDKSIADFGSGNGIFSIGASLLGASRVISIDIDPEALAISKRNAFEIGTKDIEFELGDINDYNLKVDTVFQNPPFGSQRANRHADSKFLKKALSTAEVVYSMHLSKTYKYLEGLVKRYNRSIVWAREYELRIPKMFEFHQKLYKRYTVICIKVKA